jgi:hypothetical protein
VVQPQAPIQRNPGGLAPAGVAIVMPDQALGTWIRTTSLRTPSRPPKTVSLSIFSVTFSRVSSSFSVPFGDGGNPSP